MNTIYEENNHITLMGKVTSEKRFSHEIYGEKFYVFDISVPRLSGSSDIIPVTISERLLIGDDIKVDSKVIIDGQFRSYNSYENEKSRLVLTVFAKDIKLTENQEEEVKAGKDIISNEVTLTGYICKKPIYRKTPFGREIADVLLAVNRAYNKSDYIPTIAWGRNSRFCQTLEVGDNIRVWGRLQSREYQKKISETEVVKKIAYEVSISKMERVTEENDENFNSEEHENTHVTEKGAI